MKDIDKNTILTIIYTIVDDCIKDAAIVRLLTRPGKTPSMSDSEVISLALYQELIGDSREDHFYRLHKQELRSFFPNLIDRSRYNRRKRDLWSVINAVRISLATTLHAYEQQVGIIDSAPVPVVSYKRSKRSSDFTNAQYGVCISKAMKYFGYKLHTIVSLTGVVIDFMLSGAAPYDNQVVEEFVQRQHPLLQELYGDGAYNDAPLRSLLLQNHNLKLIAPFKENQKQAQSQAYRKIKKIFACTRLMVETVNAQLQEQLHLSKHYAKSRWGAYTRINAKLAAHTLGILINTLLGRPPLSLASLAV